MNAIHLTRVILIFQVDLFPTLIELCGIPAHRATGHHLQPTNSTTIPCDRSAGDIFDTQTEARNSTIIRPIRTNGTTWQQFPITQKLRKNWPPGCRSTMRRK